LQPLLTTNEIGKMVGVSERTVANWIDRGYLQAFRTPGGHRRVDAKVLAAFLRQRGMPVPAGLDHRPSILLVEDDQQVASTLRTYLDVDGRWDVTVKHDGINGLLHIGKHKPQVVLLDVNMPGMNGLDVARKIRTNPELEDVRIVFVTGRRDLDPIIVTRETGASEFLQKPVTRQELQEAVMRALSVKPPSPT
jgi:excisionase family DNA binding protein